MLEHATPPPHRTSRRNAAPGPDTNEPTFTRAAAVDLSPSPRNASDLQSSWAQWTRHPSARRTRNFPPLHDHPFSGSSTCLLCDWTAAGMRRGVRRLGLLEGRHARRPTGGRAPHRDGACRRCQASDDALRGSAQEGAGAERDARGGCACPARDGDRGSVRRQCSSACYRVFRDRCRLCGELPRSARASTGRYAGELVARSRPLVSAGVHLSSRHDDLPAAMTRAQLVLPSPAVLHPFRRSSGNGTPPGQRLLNETAKGRGRGQPVHRPSE